MFGDDDGNGDFTRYSVFAVYITGACYGFNGVFHSKKSSQGRGCAKSFGSRESRKSAGGGKTNFFGVGDGHKILSKIALAADVPVVPVALVGTDDFWPVGATRPVLRPLDRPVIGYGYGAPVRFESSDHRANVGQVMDAIASVVREIETAMSGEPAAAV